MPAYLITYDLKKPGADYADLLKTIKGNAWARLSESSYAITSNLTAQGVYNQLKPFIDRNDQLYVITLKKPCDGQGDQTVNTWLSQYLPN